MIRFLPFLLLAFVTLIPVSASAQNDSTIKDSVYFTLDDGVMSPEEMEEEAEYVHGLCQSNAYQALYFNCECLAGAFLIQREKLGPLALQSDIYDRLTKSNKAVCGNTVAIAGAAYQACLTHTMTYRELALDNEEYCQCVGNRIARQFTQKPWLDVAYIESLTMNNMNYCDDPANRPGKKPVDPRKLN